MTGQVATEWGPLFDTATVALAVILDAFAADAVELPARQYVVPGAIAPPDCPQVTVTVTAVTIGIPGESVARPLVGCNYVRYATLRCEILRSVPVQTGNAPPSVAKMVAASCELLRDMETLHAALVNGRERIVGRGDPELGRGIPIFVGAASPTGADGGLAGSRVEVDAVF